jgi:soluble lytic murein transglycosylase-like protein
VFFCSFKHNVLNLCLILLLGLIFLIFPILVVSKTNIKVDVNTKKIIKHVKHKHWTKGYDSYFRKYSKHYFGINFPWHWFKAQSIAESSLKYKAKSKAGAIGLMQILPSTYNDIVKKNPHLGDIKHPRWNIAAGIFYDRQIYRKWKKKGVPISERLAFTFASYNAGHRRILKAYNIKNKGLSEKMNNWDAVKTQAPGETQAYVRRINALMNY